MRVDVCIQTRRSVRKYSDQDISGDTLREIVDLAGFPHPGKIRRWCGIMWSKRGPQGRRSRRTVCWATSMPKTIVRCNALVIVSV